MEPPTIIVAKRPYEMIVQFVVSIHVIYSYNLPSSMDL